MPHDQKNKEAVLGPTILYPQNIYVIIYAQDRMQIKHENIEEKQYSIEIKRIHSGVRFNSNPGSTNYDISIRASY